MSRRKPLRVRLVACLLALAVLLGGAITLVVRGDWRYRVLYAISPTRIDLLQPTVPSGESERWALADLLADPRVNAQDVLLLIDPAHPLEEDFAPTLTESENGWRMTAETLAAFCSLRERVERESGERLLIRSAYRTWEEQREELAASGGEVAAQPGASEHEAGLALDVCVRGYGGHAFLKTAAGRSVNETCAREGFIIRYPIGKKAVTGFDFEPWHLRYVGTVHAQIMQGMRLTLEEYLASLEPEQWYASGDALILRTALEIVTLPNGFSRCTVSADGCGYRIFTLEFGTME